MKRNGQRSLRVDECKLREESLVLGILQQHKGLNEAITMERLAQVTDLSTRELQHCVKHLVERHEIPIGSATGADRHGYYLIRDEAELERSVKQLWNRAMSNLVRVSKLKKISMETVFGQVPMKFSEFLNQNDKETSHVQG